MRINKFICLALSLLFIFSSILSIFSIINAEDGEKTVDYIFMVNDNEYHRQTVKNGDKLNKPIDPEVEGLQFDGWYIDDHQLFITDKDQDEVIDDEIVVVTEESTDIEVVAKFSVLLSNDEIIVDDTNTNVNTDSNIDTDTNIVSEDDSNSIEGKKCIHSFYFYEENGEYESPVKEIENVLFYLRLPAYISIDNFMLPTYVDAYVDDNTSTQRVKIETWKESDKVYKSLPANAILLEAVFSDEYYLDEKCDLLFGILLKERTLLKASGIGDSRVYRGESEDVESDLFKWKKTWTYHGTSSFQVTTTFRAGEKVKVNRHYFKDASGNKINDIFAYCLEQRWPGPKTTSNTESNYGVIANVKTLDAVYGAANAEKLRAILDHGYPMTNVINGVTWSNEEARQITQNAIRCFLADINEDAAYPAFSSANINTYIEDTKNGTAMAAVAYLVNKATRSERFNPQLTLQNNVLSLTKSGTNYVGEVSITTNLPTSAITVLADAVTALGGTASITDSKLRVTIPESKISNAIGLSVSLRYNNPKRVVDSHAYFYEPSRRKPKSTRQALLGVNITTSYDSVSVTLNANYSGKLYAVKQGADASLLNEYPISGAEFTVYTDQNCTTIAKTLDNVNAVLKVPAGSTDGKTNTIEIAPGTYYVKETKAPNGYSLNSQVQSVTVPDTTPVYVTFVNSVKRGYIQVTKQGANADLLSRYPITGAQFKVYTDQNCTTEAKDLFGNNILLTATSSGVTNTVTMALGTYYVKEITPPPKYKNNNEVKQAIIDENQIDKTIKLTYVNELDTGYIKGLKSAVDPVWVEDFPLTGAEFTVYTDQNCTTIAKDIYGNNIILVAKADGTTQTVTVESTAAGKTYYVKETKAPVNYKINTEVKTINVKTNNTASFTYEDKINTHEVSVIKTSDTSAYSVEGAEFTVYKDSACTQIAKDSADKNVVLVVKKFTEGGNVVYRTDRVILPAAKYWIKETKAPTSGAYIPDNSVTPVDLSESDVTITRKNIVSSVPIKIKKVSSQPNLLEQFPIVGAQFTLYYDSACTQKVKDINGNDAVLTVQDNEGNTNTIYVLATASKYYVKETKIPDHYKDQGVVVVNVTSRDLITIEFENILQVGLGKVRKSY